MGSDRWNDPHRPGYPPPEHDELASLRQRVNAITDGMGVLHERVAALEGRQAPGVPRHEVDAAMRWATEQRDDWKTRAEKAERERDEARAVVAAVYAKKYPRLSHVKGVTCQRCGFSQLYCCCGTESDEHTCAEARCDFCGWLGRHDFDALDRATEGG